jgi:hypothetical protein
LLAAQSAYAIFRAYVENGHWPTIDTELINIAAKFERALRDGEASALVTATALTVLAFSLTLGLALRIHETLAPSRSPLNWLKRWSKDAAAALTSDPRPPVVLLRSFQDEAANNLWGGSRSIEAVVAPTAANWGPFVAIGIPGELAPGGEAYRTYISNDAWQEAVLAWLDLSQRIVLVAGVTPSVQWEFARILERGHMTKTIFALTAWQQADLEARWAILLRSTAASPWGEALGELTAIQDIRVLQFNEGGGVRCLRCTPHLSAYEVAMRLVFDGVCAIGPGSASAHH